MLYGFSVELMHLITSWLLQPVVWGLLFFTALAVYEFGLAIGERFSVIPALVAAKQKRQLIEQGKKRIERADFITRIAPMLGLMGTLIPLGPGLSALGTGDISILTTAMTVAFDTTIIGLLAGVMGFVLGRMRRRWYDNAMQRLDDENSTNLAATTVLSSDSFGPSTHINSPSRITGSLVYWSRPSPQIVLTSLWSYLLSNNSLNNNAIPPAAVKWLISAEPFG